jgi:hypothetical protein
MKITLLILALVLATPSIGTAETSPRSEIVTAARALASQPSYRWTATPKAEGTGAPLRQGPTEGKTEKGGYTYASFTLGDAAIEMAFKGDKAAIKRESSWESAEDLLQGDSAWIGRRLKAFKFPAAESEEIAGMVKEYKKDGDAYSGELNEAGVKQLIERGRRGATEVSGAKGSARFWLKDGALVKYEFNVQGKITAGADQRQVEINRTMTVEIKEVGTTKVNLPAGAKDKLS